MSRYFLTAGLAFIFLTGAFAQDKSSDAAALEESSYVLGYNMGRSLFNAGLEVDFSALLEGIKRGAENKKQ